MKLRHVEYYSVEAEEVSSFQGTIAQVMVKLVYSCEAKDALDHLCLFHLKRRWLRLSIRRGELFFQAITPELVLTRQMLAMCWGMNVQSCMTASGAMSY